MSAAVYHNVNCDPALKHTSTRSQAVAKIADRTAKNCRDHVNKATPTVREIYLCIPNTKPLTKLEVSSSSSFGDMFDRLPEIVGSRDLGHAHFQGKSFVRPLGIPDTKLNTKFEVFSQVVLEILRSKRIGVTNLTFQGHVRSSVTWPFDSPYAISYW